MQPRFFGVFFQPVRHRCACCEPGAQFWRQECHRRPKPQWVVEAAVLRRPRDHLAGGGLPVLHVPLPLRGRPAQPRPGAPDRRAGDQEEAAATEAAPAGTTVEGEAASAALRAASDLK